MADNANDYEDPSYDQDDQATKIKFRFCKNCANLLYPGEDRENGGLIFECRHCNESERADSSCVFRNELSTTVGETAGITQDVGSDPTVSEEFYMTGIAPICTYCGDEIICEDCGQPNEDGFLCLEVDDEGSAATSTNNNTQRKSAQEALSENMQQLRVKEGEGGGSGQQ